MSDKRFFGHAVADGVVRYLSVSAIRLYDPIELSGCARKYFFRYVLGIKEPESAAMRGGTVVAKECETYLTTGADVLGPIARAGKHLLPAPGPDLEVEQQLGDVGEAIRLRGVGAPLAAIRRAAGLTAAGIPLMGAADLRHRRGEYVAPSGDLLREDPGIVVTSITDHKTTKRISDHVSPSGKVYEGYGKSVEAVHSDTQMLGYGVQEHERHQEVTHLRLEHIYYRTEGAAEAEKRTGIIPVETVLRRWERVDGVAREISDVVRETDVSKIPPNLRACKAYHKECFYAQRCPRSVDEIFAAMYGRGRTVFKEGSAPETGGADRGSSTHAGRPATATTTAPGGEIMSILSRPRTTTAPPAPAVGAPPAPPARRPTVSTVLAAPKVPPRRSTQRSPRQPPPRGRRTSSRRRRGSTWRTAPYRTPEGTRSRSTPA